MDNDHSKVSGCSLLLLLCMCCVCAEESTNHGASRPEHYTDSGHNAEFDHEAVIGSRAEHAEFEGLSEDEAKRRLSTIIQRMDSNSDERVSKQELVDWVFNSFKLLDAEEADEYFADQDVNDDARVTWDEYLQNHYGFSEEQTRDWEEDDSPEMQRYAQMVRDDREKFVAADVDGDGALSDGEYRTFYHPWMAPHMHELEVARTRRDLDTDADGFIDVSEFISPGADASDAEDVIAERENFEHFDVNHDGRLDDAELAQWVVPDHAEVAEEEATHLLEETDADGDGLLSSSEILQRFKLWVGSAATDYGLQLDDRYHDPQEL